MAAPDSPSSSSSSLMMSTNTLLAVPDGPISASSSDLRSHSASYIGGYPTFPSLPSSLSAQGIPETVNCGTCHRPIPLLAQVYCPPEGGENDRTVYVFACPRVGCARRDASIRAFRASIRNEEYVRDVLEQKAKKEAEAAAEKKRERERQKVNPFSMGATTAVGAAGGLGSSLFGGAAPSMPFGNPFSVAPSEPAPVDEQTLDISSLSINSPAETALPAKPQAGPSRPPVTYGPPIPAYQPPQYLSTFDEYIPRPDAGGKGKLAQYVEDGEKAGRKAGIAQDAADASGGGAGAEQWERVLPKGVDEVFERFVSRLEDAEGGDDQVLRYDLGATPLPYSSKSTLYQKLFPKAAPGQPISATRSSAYSIVSPAKRSSKPNAGDDSDDPDSDDEEASELERRYHPEGVVPACPRCGSSRVFELQLVPGLISALSSESLTTEGIKRKKSKKKQRAGEQSAEERRKEIEALLAGRRVEGADGEAGADADADGLGEVSETGMEWGTVMVFGCKADCVGFGEEWVGVEWEEMA